MTDKEFRRLSRTELVDIIFELQQRCEACEAEKQVLKKKLEEKELKISRAGTLAEAVISINGVLEAAQSAADQYLLSLKNANKDAEQLIFDAKKESKRIIREAQDHAGKIEESAQKKADQIWDDFREKANAVIQAHQELSISTMRMTKDAKKKEEVSG